MRLFLTILLTLICASAWSQILPQDQQYESRCWDSKWNDRRFCELFPDPSDTSHVIKYTESRNFVMREEFVDSIRHGKLVHWNMIPGGDTVKVYEVNFVEGDRDGIVREWHLNGKLKSIGEYDHGMFSGTWTSYLESGIKQEEVRFDGEGKKQVLYTFTIPDTTMARLDTILKHRLGDDLFQNSAVIGGNQVKGYGQNITKFRGRQYYAKDVSINLPVDGGGYEYYTFEVQISTFGELLTDLDDVIPSCADDADLCEVIPEEKAKKKRHPGGDRTTTSAELGMHNKKLVWFVRHVVSKEYGVRVIVDAHRGRVILKEDFVPVEG